MIFRLTNPEDIISHLPVSAEFNVQSLESFITQRGEAEMLIPRVLGQSLYDALNAEYNAAAPLSARMEAIITLSQYIVANYAYLRYLPFAQVIMGKDGIRIKKSETSATAFEWQIKLLATELDNATWEGVERLLDYLETNKANYAEWVNSKPYTIFYDGYIHTAKQFSDICSINDKRRTFTAMRYIQKRIEKDIIERAIGTDLATEIITQLKTNTVSVTNAKLLPYIQSAVAYLAVSAALKELPVTLSADGIEVSTGASDFEQSGGPRDKALDNKSMLYESIGNKNLANLNAYLYANITDFPLFESSDSYVAPAEITPDYSGPSIETTNALWI